MKLCRYHWEMGNRRCLAHGYEKMSGREPRVAEFTIRNADNMDHGSRQVGVGVFVEDHSGFWMRMNLFRWWKMKHAMKASMDALKKMGPAAKGLLNRLNGVKDPAAMHGLISSSLDEVIARRKEVGARLDETHNTVVHRKALFLRAVGAGKQILEMELRTLLNNYQTLQRRLAGLLESERILNLAMMRLEEDHDNRMTGLDESLLDDITDRIAESAGARLEIRDAAEALEQAGEIIIPTDQPNIDDLLAGFVEEIPIANDGGCLTTGKEALGQQTDVKMKRRDVAIEREQQLAPDKE